MNKNEPESTIKWASYHLFNRSFCERYSANLLTFDENLMLITATILHCEMMFESRNFLQFKLKLYDRKRIKNLRDMLSNMITDKFKSNVEIDTTVPALRIKHSLVAAFTN